MKYLIAHLHKESVHLSFSLGKNSENVELGNFIIGGEGGGQKC